MITDTSLKSRILFPLTLGLFSLLLAFLVSLFWMQRNNIKQRGNRQFKSTEHLFYSQQENDAHLLSNMLETIINDQTIQAALKAKDRKALLFHTASLFKRISSQHPITHLYFSDARRINLLRVHQPDRYGDRIDRLTTLRAEKTGKIAYGLELGPLGTLTLRVVAPATVNGALIGFVELGEEIDHITAKMKKTLGVELIIYLHKKFLDRSSWEAGMKMMGRTSDWGRFSDVVIAEQTLKDIPEALTKFLSQENHISGATAVDIFSQDRRYRGRFLEIRDAQGLEVGDMAVLIDVTSQVSQFYSTMAVIAVFSVLLGGVLFFVFRLFLGRIENQLTKSQQKIIDLEKDRTRMESEAKLSSVAQSMNDAMISIEPSGKITYWNPAAVIMFGYQEEEVLDRPLIMLLPERYREAHLRGIERLQSGGESKIIGKTVELFGTRKDGTEFPLELSLAQWKIGKELFYTGLIRDITQRKKTEQALQTSEEKYRSIFENAVEGIFQSEPEGKYLSVNPAFARMAGYNSPEEMIRTVTSIGEQVYVRPEDRVGFKKTIEKTGSIEGFETEHYRKDGSKFGVSLNARTVRDNAGKVLFYEGTIEDITFHKQVEEDSKRNADLQKVINSLLRLSLEDLPMETILDKAIDLILAVPWLVLESRGAIFLAEEDPGVLVMKAQRGLNRILEEACSRVPFGRCICGKAALKKEIEFADRIDERHDIRYETMIPHGHYCVPILFSGQTLGVINLYVKEGHNRNSKEEEFLMALSQTLAGVIIRQRTEKSLRESEDRYRDLVETSRDLIFIHDLKGQILWVNEEPVRILGYNKDHILKMNIRDLLVPERKSEFDDYLASIRSQDVASGLMVIQTAKGERRIWEYHNTLRTEGVIEPIVRGIAHDVTERMRAEKELKKTLEKLRRSMRGIILAMASTVEIRDPYTAGHQRRVADLARAIAQEMGLPEVQVDGLRMASIVHDLGKISVPVEILSKPTKLSELEFGLIKIHSEAGYDILKDIDFPWPIARMVLEHHEKIDGSGYPKGLKGDEILLESKILTVADVVEAIASNRPYRPARGIKMALEEIEKNKGIHYDPEVVEACLKLFREKGFKLE